MSYDLSFLASSAAAAPGRDALGEYFRARPNYTQNDGQFWYANEDTGVYFSFEWSDGRDELPPDSDDPPEAVGPADDFADAGLAFNLNYVRPHIFGLEAETEVSSLVRRFGLLVDDPQMNGMGRGAYSPEGFLSGWNDGNRFAYSALAAQGAMGADVPGSSLPAARLEHAWRWNLNRGRLQEELNAMDVFVPKIMTLLHEGEVKTFVVWGDAMPAALPDTDLIVMAREDMAPRRFFRRKPDVTIATQAELEPIRKRGRRVGGDGGYLLFDYAVPPDPIVDFFKARSPLAGELKGVPTDKVLTRELLVEAMTSPALTFETGDGA